MTWCAGWRVKKGCSSASPPAQRLPLALQVAETIEQGVVVTVFPTPVTST